MTDDISPDLRDLIALWAGHELPPDRCQALIDRLEADPDFRRSFSDEVWTTSEVRSATDDEPQDFRALLALAHGDDRPDAPVAIPRVEAPARRQRHRVWATLTVAAGLLLAVMAGWWGTRGTTTDVSAADRNLAVVIHSAGVEAQAGSTQPLAVGTTLSAGRFAVPSGVAVLLGVGGETTTVEGPADLELDSRTQMTLHRGRIRVKVPNGASGYTVRVPSAAVVDLGTEFGVSVGPDGQTHVAVFSGSVEILHTPADGPPRSCGGLKAKQAAVIDPANFGFKPESMTAHRYPVVPAVTVLDAPYSPDYPTTVRTAGPWGYWRFEKLDKELVPNEVPDRPGLRKSGAITLAGTPGRPAVVFRPDDATQNLFMDGSWTPSATQGFALECWAIAESLAPQTLVSLIPVERPQQTPPAGLVEIAGLRPYWSCPPGAVRFLYPVPPQAPDEIGLVSAEGAAFVPFRWHHVVAQRNGGDIELYLDGRMCGSSRIEADGIASACRLLLGRLKPEGSQDPMQVRGFVGRLAEVAIYSRPLLADEIKTHAGGDRLK